MSGCAAAAVTARSAKKNSRVFLGVRKRSRSISQLVVVHCSLSFSEIEVERGVGPNWVLASEKLPRLEEAYLNSLLRRLIAGIRTYSAAPPN